MLPTQRPLAAPPASLSPSRRGSMREGSPLPSNEDARLTLLHACRILDTAPERRFDDIAKLAAHICGAPIAVVSLVDEHRQWFKARVGLSATETARNISFCTHTILTHDVMVVPDATRDPRFAENPLVTGAPHIRFYAGAPLVDPTGLVTGTLCVIDGAPRPGLSPKQHEMLELLASQVVDQMRMNVVLQSMESLVLERDRLAAEQRSAEARLRALFDESSSPALFLTLDARVQSANPALCRLLGRSQDSLLGRNAIDELLHPDEREPVRVALSILAVAPSARGIGRHLALHPDGSPFPVELTATVVHEDGVAVGISVTVTSPR